MKIKCDGHSSDGVISILILNNQGNTSRYEYKVEGARIADWKRRILYTHRHGTILNEIKHNATWFKQVG